MVDGQAGKGDRVRPVNRKKFSKNYIKIFGVKCKRCGGKARGIPDKNGGWITCPDCNGLGKVERKRNGKVRKQ